ncbi:MAG TPA: SCE4755 family polysaccharide monooxygenase-like protein [Kofleriaceae bacterium]|jgi:uncharacterized protein (TIGR03382 family)|nr:SCE4755 family polysaccharide monooxygenase-like protein [Kofleriaceae bacterium]
MRRDLPVLAVLLAPAVAAAHVRITSPAPRSTTVLKDPPCGTAGLPRANVHTVRPGSTLHLVWDEYVVHPGWFRISFQQNGDAFETPPASNGPTGTGTSSNYPTENLTGKTDPGTGSRIIADRIAHGTLSMDVPLPNVECNNCTLQLIQMMTDKPPYTTDAASDDIYFACVDLVLSASAPDPGTGGGSPDAGTDGGGGAGGGGCAAAGGSTGILALAAAGLLLRRRTRRFHMDDSSR